MLVREVGMKILRVGITWIICIVVIKSNGIPKENPKKEAKRPIARGIKVR